MAVRKLFEKIAKAIKWDHIDDNAVRTNNIQDATLTESKYATGSVSERAVADGAISSPKLASSAVGTPQLANASVTLEKLSSTAKDKAAVGLSDVDNTSDADKPISSATQAALLLKEPLLPEGGDTAKFLRGDKTFVRLDTPTVMVNTSTATGSLDSVTAPGIYSYQTATSLPLGAGALGTLIVSSNTSSQRAQLLLDSLGLAWTRGYNGTVWSAWRVLSDAAAPSFYGTGLTQTHTAASEERCNFTTVSTNVITNSNGELTLARAGKYFVTAHSTGPWKQDATGFGRSLRVQLNGSTVAQSDTDVPIVWGSGVGAFSLSTQVLVTAAAGAKLESRLSHNTNVSILAHHRISVEWRE